MKKIMLIALCALSMLAVSSCNLFYSDVSNPEIEFGWAGDGTEDFNGYPCIGSTMVYVEAFQTTFEPIATVYKSWTYSGGTLYAPSKDSKEVDSFVKSYADKAIALAESNCKAKGYDLPSGDTFRVVYKYGAGTKYTKVLNYLVK